MDILLWLIDMASESSCREFAGTAADGCNLLSCGLDGACRADSSARESMDLRSADFLKLVHSSGSLGEGGALLAWIRLQALRSGVQSLAAKGWPGPAKHVLLCAVG